MRTKITLLFSFLLLSISFIHSQADTINQKPFTYKTSYIGDVVQNFKGGIKKGGTYLGMANIKIHFHTNKCNLWDGGDFFINAANLHGSEPTSNLTGNYQVTSNIEAGELTYLHELWYKQNFGKATLILGLQDVAVEFLSSENAGLFLNSSFGVPSTIATNIPVPIFPLTALGGQFHIDMTKKMSFKFAIFDGVPDDFSINKFNTKWRFSERDGITSFSEFTFKNGSDKRPGSYKIGSYYHSKHIITTKIGDGLVIIENHPAKYGIYLVFDQHIYKSKTGKELSFFTQSSLSSKAINENWYYIGGGINYKGFISKRESDIFGLGVAHAGISNTVGNETIFEITYKAHLGETLFIQPDFQYILNPAGTDNTLKDSFVGLIRFGLNF